MTDPPKKVVTLCIVHEPPRVLLGLKKRGFGAGRWNGFGGKLRPEESLEDAARREFSEETTADVGTIERCGVLTFRFVGDPVALEVQVFRGAHIHGEPKETEEMRPQWFHESEIPYADMWPDDYLWLPLFLRGKQFSGEFLFRDHDTLLQSRVEEVATLKLASRQ